MFLKIYIPSRWLYVRYSNLEPPIPLSREPIVKYKSEEMDPVLLTFF